MAHLSHLWNFHKISTLWQDQEGPCFTLKLRNLVHEMKAEIRSAYAAQQHDDQRDNARISLDRLKDIMDDIHAEGL